MKKEFQKRFLFFLFGAFLFGGTIVYASEYLSARDISFTPNNQQWKVSNLEEAINSLYEKKEVNYDIHGMTLAFDEETKRPKYLYQEKEILPIYWYGYSPLDGVEVLTPWYETNTQTSFSYQEESVVVNRSVSVTNSKCVGGFTTPFRINLGKYQSFHLLVNQSNLGNARMHFVSKNGNLGSETSNEVNWLVYLPATVSTPTEFVADISSNSGWYYLSVSSFCRAGTMDIAAIWLE